MCLRSPRHHRLGTHSQWGPGLPISSAQGVGMAVCPPAPPVINFHQWPRGSRAGGWGVVAEKHSAFPLIAKINTLKFLQEAEECRTAGKNCFIICNNTKARGGGRGGRMMSCERRGKAETKGWLWQRGLLLGGSPLKDGVLCVPVQRRCPGVACCHGSLRGSQHHCALVSLSEWCVISHIPPQGTDSSPHV